ncbi:hypothetical protein F4778DRAFT_559499 [Xylariomycetidae sp. FL2044]|nr:hypothetical protein F4778DRAFT_559499 [Xylariomycetidae sp. FL2044]
MATLTLVSPTPPITSPPTAQFTPAPGCLDPGNIWEVTTSCYLDVRTSIQFPDWLTCTVANFGAPEWNDPSCAVPYPPQTTVDGEVRYYADCPAGYTVARSSSYPGWYSWEHEGEFDITAYDFGCCPTQYNFEIGTETIDPKQHTSTEHDGRVYSLFIFPFPGCSATSVSELSGSAIAMETTSNTMAWDKREAAVTKTWDYEDGTLYAHREYFTYTVYQGTHTCYESCSTWFSYYYPDGVAPLTVTAPVESPTTISAPYSPTSDSPLSDSTITSQQTPQSTGPSTESNVAALSSSSSATIPPESTASQPSLVSADRESPSDIGAPSAGSTDVAQGVGAAVGPMAFSVISVIALALVLY